LIRYADNWKAILAMTLVVSVVLCTASMVLLPKMLGKAILYLFFSSALYVQPLTHPSSTSSQYVQPLIHSSSSSQVLCTSNPSSILLFFSSALYVQPLIQPLSIAFACWLLIADGDSLGQQM
jgi:hypothetical protein